MDIQVKAKIKDNSSAEEIFQAILVSRGYKTPSQQESFLRPPEPTLDYLLKMSGLTKSVLKAAQKLLDSHLKSNHDICVFGDYDADGVTSTAIMWQALSAYGKKLGSASRVLPFIPDRHKHGYGLGDKAVADVLSGAAFSSTQFTQFSPKLIITVDTGIVAHVGIKTFRDHDIDVIITDHHLPTSELPNATEIIHSTTTSGAGVAWIVAMYLLGDSAIKLLDLATIGIVGDMMPLTGLNRAIVVRGLRTLTTTKRPGIVAMKSAMGVGDKHLTTYDISFGMAPRINAAGRIYNPLDALRLLCSSDQDLTKELTAKIEAHNKDRQEYTEKALLIASNEKSLHKIVVIKGDYHEGVIGLVAGKLTELFHRPAVVMSDNGQIIKGSARSIPGVNITEMLRSLKTPFLGLGGHDQAAGFSIASDQVDNMIKELESLSDQQIVDELLVKRYSADLSLKLSSTTMALAKLLHTLEPYGMANQKPKFLLKNLQVLEDRKLGSEGKHRKLTIEQGGTTRELMLFNTKESYPLKSIQSLICTIDINVWRDKESLQLIGSHVEL